MRAGPKGSVDDSMLPWRPRSSGSARFAAFCERYIRVPKGKGARKPLKLRQWQRELAGSVLDADPQPRIAGWCLPRGQGKSTLVAALGLYELMLGGEGATVVVAAVDERQAGIVGGIATRMVELHPDLASRVQTFQNRLLVPSRGASFVVLPASPASLEGLDYTLAIADEIGRINQETWEVLALAQGKRERSTLIGIGTPGPTEENVLANLRAYSLACPEDTSQVYREHSAAGFEDHPPDCLHCWGLANPALDDFLHRDAMRALLPPKMSEQAFRRARLCQHVTGNDEPALPPGLWDSLSTDQSIPDGAEVVLSFDGSYSGTDCTVILASTVSATPHMDVVGVWQRPEYAQTDWRVPVLQVEQEIRDACQRWKVLEIAADPYRWQRSLEVLKEDGLPCLEFPQAPSRMCAATADFLTACVNDGLSHSGNVTLAAHLANAVLHEDNRGARMVKATRSRHAGQIDAAICAVMGHSRSTWLAMNKPKPKRYASFRA
ncbi:terminase large subunit domain-containing protein [Mycobacterium shigaense]|uniref:Terminase n=1 Tax=Mycobacterium shigaense TaxID=722731 RepID=A0A1Z4EGE2_9MYCO|nr:terminase large subunit [Mycobacterium shigaense]PRI16736.1 terminase [Mycobacterium shigaense]BAX92044.1 terminase [Mycobacterium shigaense]